MSISYVGEKNNLTQPNLNKTENMSISYVGKKQPNLT